MPPKGGRITPIFVAPSGSKLPIAEKKKKKKKEYDDDYFARKRAKIQARIDNGGGFNNRLNSIIHKYEKTAGMKAEDAIGIPLDAVIPKVRIFYFYELPTNSPIYITQQMARVGKPTRRKCAKGYHPYQRKKGPAKMDIEICAKNPKKKRRTKAYYKNKIASTGVRLVGASKMKKAELMAHYKNMKGASGYQDAVY
jgi:hypothetical protein